MEGGENIKCALVFEVMHAFVLFEFRALVGVGRSRPGISQQTSTIIGK